MTLTLVQLLASALLLSRMSGSLSPAQADYHRIKRALAEQLEDTLKAQAAAKKEGHTIQSLGNDDLFIHHALESLAETPRDVGSSAPLFDAIARIFFAVEGQVRFHPIQVNFGRNLISFRLLDSTTSI